MHGCSKLKTMREKRLERQFLTRIKIRFENLIFDHKNDTDFMIRI